MNNSYFFHHREYTKDGLLTYAENKLKQPNLQDWERDLFSFIVQWFSATDYISIHTSGSTGTPKEIRISKDRMVRSAERTLQYFNVKPFENILLCLPVKYIAGMMMVVRAFTGSLNLLTLPSNQLQLDSVKDSIGFASMVPLQMDRLLNERQNFDLITKLLLGGTPVSFNLTEKLKVSFKGLAWETYGMTETITHVAVRKIFDEVQVFHALPGISFSSDEHERLIISDPFIQDQPVYTNDRVELLSKISFRLLGRFDNVINSGGIKIQPEELERLLEPVIETKYCITSVPDEKFGEMVVLVVEKGGDLNQIREKLRNLEGYKQPKKVIEIEKIPVTSNGKVDYKGVRVMINKLSI